MVFWACSRLFQKLSWAIRASSSVRRFCTLGTSKKPPQMRKFFRGGDELGLDFVEHIVGKLQQENHCGQQKKFNRDSEVVTAKAPGSTGDPPVPGGDSPPGTGETHEFFCASFYRASVSSVPSGQWPDGTGGSPVLPVPTSEFRFHRDKPIRN